MKNIGVICEYNPFHNGHKKQLQAMGEENGKICLMSGNFVQRGEPAVLDKFLRARAAVACGADLVLELPVTCALRSAEGFAAGGVEILDALGCVDGLCFGSETGEERSLMEAASLLLSPNFPGKLKEALSRGVSFPRARAQAAEALGGRADLLQNPNDILAVEYCKALLRRGSAMEPVVLKRRGSYHDSRDRENPSASVLRTMEGWEDFVPPEALQVFAGEQRHTLAAGERAMLARLWTMEEEGFSALPFGSEGLWRRVMQACRSSASLEEILERAKSKRYTRSRLMRMLMCGFLGISGEILEKSPEFVRVLAMNERGRQILHQAKKTAKIPVLHPGQEGTDREYAGLERRCEDLFGLFSQGAVPPAGRGKERRLLRL